MEVSDNGLNLIKKWEGCRLTAYKDSVGVWTIGWGTTNSDKSITGTTIKSGLKISQETADDWLRKSVNKKYVPLVSKYKYNYNQNQFDALVSFCYNIGSIDQLTSNGKRSLAEIANHITAYCKAGGKTLQGLVNRRNDELKLYNTPVSTGYYQAHVQNIGWQDWKNAGEIAGTTGKSLRVEAIKITGDVQYRVHVQDKGWMEWHSGGAIAGTTGQSLRIEAIEFKSSRTLRAKAHVQNIGWQNEVSGTDIVIGTTGKALRLEAFYLV